MRTSARFVFTGRPPASFVVVFVLLAINFVAGFTLGMEPPSGFLHDGGLQSALSAYVDRWWLPLHFVLLAAALGVAWLHRDQLQRVEPPPPPSGPAGPWEWLALVIVIPAAYSLVGGAAVAILLREAGWTAALVMTGVFLLISLATVAYASRPLIRRGPPPLEWPWGLSLAGAITLAALALVASLFF